LSPAQILEISNYVVSLTKYKGKGTVGNGRELGGRVLKLHIRKGLLAPISRQVLVTWRNSEYYWHMVFECIYCLVSAMHGDDHRELSMPKVIRKTFKRTALRLGHID